MLTGLVLLSHGIDQVQCSENLPLLRSCESLCVVALPMTGFFPFFSRTRSLFLVYRSNAAFRIDAYMWSWLVRFWTLGNTRASGLSNLRDRVDFELPVPFDDDPPPDDVDRKPPEPPLPPLSSLIVMADDGEEEVVPVDNDDRRERGGRGDGDADDDDTFGGETAVRTPGNLIPPNVGKVRACESETDGDAIDRCGVRGTLMSA